MVAMYGVCFLMSCCVSCIIIAIRTFSCWSDVYM